MPGLRPGSGGVQGPSPRSGRSSVTAEPQGAVLTEAAARWLYCRVPFRDVCSTEAEQVMKAVM